MGKKDRVYFLGDMAYGKGSRDTDYWLEILNGDIIFIRGNHDCSKKMKLFERYVLAYKNHEFLFVHRPENAGDWKGWVIHGHHHNHYMDIYPFINGERKTINASVELIDYNPVSFDELFLLNFDKIKRMDTIKSAAVM